MGTNQFNILRMDKTIKMILIMQEIIVGVFQQFFQARRVVHTFCPFVPVPQTVADATHGKITPFFADPQRFFEFLVVLENGT